ncbi:hypothetical protein PBCVCan184_256L [Paramecium bursaria Chlorella virus Can18-4]|nr:hypothetical protein PBCVCan184_256L [Paramecium bursaria Chlorella virus Can18-4]
MPSYISHAEEYLFEEFVEESPSDNEEMQKELNEKYLTYDDEMEAFEDYQTSMAYGISEDEDFFDEDDYYYTEDE